MLHSGKFTGETTGERNQNQNQYLPDISSSTRNGIMSEIRVVQVTWLSARLHSALHSDKNNQIRWKDTRWLQLIYRWKVGRKKGVNNLKILEFSLRVYFHPQNVFIRYYEYFEAKIDSESGYSLFHPSENMVDDWNDKTWHFRKTLVMLLIAEI